MTAPIVVLDQTKRPHTEPRQTPAVLVQVDWTVQCNDHRFCRLAALLFIAGSQPRLGTLFGEETCPPQSAHQADKRNSAPSR